jgi:2-methylcitrate dehydratase PrpD
MLVAERIADFILETNLDNINAEVQEKAKQCFIDCMGCMIAGSKESAPDLVLRYVRVMGGNPVASVVGLGYKTSPYQAAVINGVSAHVLDYDDVSASMTGHPSVVLLPAVLAAGEDKKMSGKQVLEAYIVGVEVACAISRGLNPTHYSKGWHTTSSLGIFGAAAAVGKIIGLNRRQLINALGIAASEASGLKINFGTMTKSFHAGRAAAKGLQAAYLAAEGFTSSDVAFEGDAGFFKVTTGEYDIEKILHTMGSPFEFEKPGISIKPYTSCKGTHNGIDATLFLAEQYDLRPHNIAKIECGVLPVAKDILIYPKPKTGLEGKFSMNFCVALALTNRAVKMDDFTDEMVNNRAIRELADKVEMSVDPELAKAGYFQGTWDTIVKIVIKDGKQYSKRVDQAKGDPGNPLTEPEIMSKFADCASKLFSPKKVNESATMLRNLANIKNIQELLRILN